MRDIITVILAVLLTGCFNITSENTGDDHTTSTGSNETTLSEIDGMSIYQISSVWETQDSAKIEFKDLQGQVLVVVMIYTTCQSACPRLVADMKSIESKVSGLGGAGIKYVLVSIDPTHDTPARLKQFSVENQMEDTRWLFLRGTEESVREFANIVAVRYTQISPLEFSHANIISVFDRNGVMRHQQEGLSVDYTETVDKVLELASEKTVL